MLFSSLVVLFSSLGPSTPQGAVGAPATRKRNAPPLKTPSRPLLDCDGRGRSSISFQQVAQERFQGVPHDCVALEELPFASQSLMEAFLHAFIVPFPQALAHFPTGLRPWPPRELYETPPRSGLSNPAASCSKVPGLHNGKASSFYS